jgi:hypothetical protein
MKYANFIPSERDGRFMSPKLSSSTSVGIHAEADIQVYAIFQVPNPRGTFVPAQSARLRRFFSGLDAVGISTVPGRNMACFPSQSLGCA